MTKIISIIAISMVISLTELMAQYVPNGLYLTDPDRILAYVDSCASFWQGVQDRTYGGFYMDVDRSGSVMDSSTKNVVSQSRDAYGFTRTFMLTGNEQYLDMAESALNFMSSYLWDDEYGGWFNRVNSDGTNASVADTKTAFDQHYALLGLMAYVEATGDTVSWNKIEQGLDFNDRYLWDSRAEYQGYFDHLDRNGSSPNAKSFNSTVDAITTHMFNLYLLTGEQRYADRLMQLKDNIMDYLVNNMPAQAIGFPELFFSDWSIDPSLQRTIMGHVLKTGWCLARIYTIEQNPEYLTAAESLIRDVWDNGYDHEFGGPYKDYDRATGEMYMYGAVDTAKAWWQMEQAVTAGLLMYEITNEDWYLQMADESLEFFRKYFVDHTYGEVYADRSRIGGRVYYSGGYWDENKGSGWKAAYHSIETGYYAYLYGKLLFNPHEAKLFYRYNPVSYARKIQMNPLAISDENFSVTEVIHADSSYLLFDPVQRILTLPEQVGGIFEIHYLYSYPHTISSGSDLYPGSLKLAGNYPNPFNGATTIRFSLSRKARVQVDLYNIQGQKIITLADREFGPGEHRLLWQANELGSGIYFYRFHVDGIIKTGKMTLLK